MWLGREARFETIFLSCIAVLFTRTIASGTEEAAGPSARFSDRTCPVPCSGSHFFLDSRGWSLSPAGSLRPWRPLRVHEDPMRAMALPDGPGAVCLGVAGFVCISLVKNRRIWIGLCLFILGHGRLVAARLSKTSVPVLDPAAPDLLNESGPDRFCCREPSCRGRRVSDPRSGTWLQILDVLGLVPEVRHGSVRRLWDDRDSKGRSLQADVTFDGSEMALAVPAGWNPANGSVSLGSVEWARPPPRRDRDNTG